VRALSSFALVLALSSLSFYSMANDIVFLGDDVRIKLLASCKACQTQKLTFATPHQGANAQEVANSAQNARHAVIVVDVSSGPLQITREHILIARQAEVPSLSFMFVNMSRLEGMPDAGELLELEEREVRELMNKYEMGGDRAMVFHDSTIRSVKKLSSAGVGMDSVLRAMQRLPERRPVALSPFSGKKFFAFLYLLTTQESKFTVPLTNGSSVGLWINGQSVRTRVRSKQTLQPGGTGELEFETEKPIVAPIGSRLLVEQDGKVIAAGVLMRGS